MAPSPHRDDMNSLARNYRSDSDVEVDVTDPRRARRIDDSSADLGALLLVKLHVHVVALISEPDCH